MVSALKAEGQTTNVPAPAPQPLSPKAVVLFDIDGVIRDVAGSYRRAIVETVHHYGGWRPEPPVIDALKGEGRWNNDWDASLELLRRRGGIPLPSRAELVTVFSSFYFGGDPDGDPTGWTGFIGQEPLLVTRGFFERLEAADLSWGFVSGAEPPSARFVLERRLGLVQAPLIAMGDAPDKPDPTGLIRLARQLTGEAAGPGEVPTVYLGDTVADVVTVAHARQRLPDHPFLSLAVAPPHLQHTPARAAYEASLRQAGADHILQSTDELTPALLETLLKAMP